MVSSLARHKVSEGYKQTEVGVIPGDWDLHPINYFAEVSSGGTPNRENKDYWNGNIPWVTTTLINGQKIESAEQFITEKGLVSSAAKWLKKGTILMAMYGQGKTRGKVSILGIDATINQACAAIVVKKAVEVDFLLHYLNSRYEKIRELSNSGGQENLSGAIIKTIKVPIPLDKEQTAVANALSDVDALITSLEKLIVKKRAIKTAAMQQLLTGKKRLPPFDKNDNAFSANSTNANTSTAHAYAVNEAPAPYNLQGENPKGTRKGYKQTELGEIPEDWEASQVKNHSKKTTVGFVGSMAHLFVEQGIPLLRGQNILENKLDMERLVYIGKHTHDKWKKSALMPGDVGIVRVGYPGTACVIPNDSGELNAASLVIVGTDNSTLNPYFLSYYLNSEYGRKQIDSFLVGGAQQVFNTKIAAEFQLPIPGIEEQKSIVKVFSDMDIEIDGLELRLHKTQQLKQGMMQELLTGRTRLL